MEINDRKTILKYLNITLLSYSRICYFTPQGVPDTRIKIRFLSISDHAVQMQSAYAPSNLVGYLIFYSYTYIFRCLVKLQPGSEADVYLCDIPTMIETFDRRQFARLKFESRENKIATIFNKSFNTKMKVIITDISGGGFGFAVVDAKQTPKVGDNLIADIELGEKSFKTIATVVQVRGDQIGCAFLEKSLKFQVDINTIAKQEIEWRSELMLLNLKKREEIVKSFRQIRESETALTVNDFIVKRNALDSVIDFVIKNFQASTGIVLARERVEFKETTALPFPISLNFNINFSNDHLFICHFSSQSEILFKLAPPVFYNRLDGVGINANIVMEELGRKMMSYPFRTDKSIPTFSLTDAQMVEVNKRMLSELLKRPSIRVQFTSYLGEFTLILSSDNLITSLNLASNAKVREFMTMEEMDLLEPISYSTLRVFTEFLKLEIREKSVLTREQLLPRFEISIILDIFFKDFEGKVILNLSKKLALKIYEILVHESAADFNEDVKDAIAEVTNMITGNAKSEFEKFGVYYKISTPVVLESREGVIIYAKNIKFVSSVYWTNEGFFDLNFSLYKK